MGAPGIAARTLDTETCRSMTAGLCLASLAKAISAVRGRPAQWQSWRLAIMHQLRRT